MADTPQTKLGIIYADWMPAEAGNRLVKAAEQSLAEGVTVDHVRDGLCFGIQFAAATMHVPLNAQARRKIDSARNAVAKYDLIARELGVEGIELLSLSDGWFDRAISHLDALAEEPLGVRRADYVRKRIYPYLLALYELSFCKTPTAYYDGGAERDGPALAFVRRAAVELDETHSKMFARPSVASALFGDGKGGTLSVSLPQGDSLRRALEPFIKARADIKTWIEPDSGPESDHARAYRYAYNLLKFRVFSNNMN